MTSFTWSIILSRCVISDARSFKSSIMYNWCQREVNIFRETRSFKDINEAYFFYYCCSLSSWFRAEDLLFPSTHFITWRLHKESSWHCAAVELLFSWWWWDDAEKINQWRYIYLYQLLVCVHVKRRTQTIDTINEVHWDIIFYIFNFEQRLMSDISA